MKNTSKIIYLFLLVASSALYAQQPSTYCGTAPDPDYLNRLSKMDRSYLNTNLRASTLYIPIHYHIVRKSDGTGGFPLQYIYTSHCELNERFKASDIQFYIDSISYINNSTAYAFASTNSIYTYFNQYNTYRRVDINGISTPIYICNVYFNNGAGGTCGVTVRPSNSNVGGGMFINGSFDGGFSCSAPKSTTLVHEMGHWLDLEHTFYGWEGLTYVANNNNSPLQSNRRERVARTGATANCTTAGDGFCDTDPDYESDRWSCNGNPAVNFKDPAGVSFRPDSSLYMSYSSDACQGKFSPNQMGHMYNVLQTDADWKYILQIPSPNNTILDTTVLIYPTEAQRVSKTNTKLLWNKVPGAAGYHILVSSNKAFNVSQTLTFVDTFTTDTSFLITKVLANNTNYYWKVRPISNGAFCTDFNSVRSFKTSSLSVNALPNATSCSGNIDGSVKLTTTGSAGPYSYEFSTIGIITTDSATGLEAGFYAVTVTDMSNSTLSVIYGVTIPDAAPISVSISQSGNTATANVTGGTAPYTVQWSTGTLGNIASVTNGNRYTVTITDAKGCTKSTTLDLSAIGVFGINAKNLQVYPNPAVNEITLQFDADVAENGKVKIYNVSGAIVMELPIKLNADKNILKIDKLNLSSGSYAVSLESEHLIATRRIVIM